MDWVDVQDKWYPLGKSFREYNDCAVIAFAIVCDTSYSNAHKYLKSKGRKNRRGTPYSVSESAFKGMRKFKHVKGPYASDNKISLSNFCKTHPEGRFFVGVRGHALAVIDGVVHDYKAGPRRQVKRAYRVYKPGEYNEV